MYVTFMYVCIMCLSLGRLSTNIVLTLISIFVQRSIYGPVHSSGALDQSDCSFSGYIAGWSQSTCSVISYLVFVGILLQVACISVSLEI